jgi:hypothetical protein
MLHHELTDHILGGLVAVHTALGPDCPNAPIKTRVRWNSGLWGFRFKRSPPMKFDTEALSSVVTNQIL